VDSIDGMSRGERECLRRLLWYQRRYGRVHPSQKKLTAGLGVSERTLRTYLAELRKLGLLSVRQGGNGRSASYLLVSGLTSRLLPGCFRAEKTDAGDYLAGNQSFTDENFLAERGQSRSSSSSYSDQSECTVVAAPRSILFLKSPKDLTPRVNA
jgi:hypothetical protein